MQYFDIQCKHGFLFSPVKDLCKKNHLKDYVYCGSSQLRCITVPALTHFASPPATCYSVDTKNRVFIDYIFAPDKMNQFLSYNLIQRPVKPSRLQNISESLGFRQTDTIGTNAELSNLQLQTEKKKSLFVYIFMTSNHGFVFKSARINTVTFKRTYR